MLLPNVALDLSANIAAFVGVTHAGSFQKHLWQRQRKYRLRNKAIGWKEGRVSSFSGRRNLKFLISCPPSLLEAEKEANPKPEELFILHSRIICHT